MRLTGPLAFAGCGEQVAERSGTLNISIEAMMLAGAFFGLWGSSFAGGVVTGLVLGSVAGSVVGVVHANFSHRLNANTFVVGLTLNVLLLGLTSFLNETIEFTPHQAGVVKIPLLAIPADRRAALRHRWPIYLSCRSSRCLVAGAAAPGGGSRSGRAARTRRPPTSPEST